MPAWPLVTFLAGLSLAAGLVSGWPLLQHTGIALGVLLLFGAASAFLGRRGLTASNLVNRVRLTAGDQMIETCALHKRGPWPALRVEVQFEPPAEPSSRHSAYLGPGRARKIARTSVVRRRGRFEAAGCTVCVTDPFRLFALRAHSLPPRSVIVYPRPIEVSEAVEAISRAVAGARMSRRDNADASLGDLRYYNPGDPPSRIHWKSTARVGALMITDPEPKRFADVWIVVDLGGGAKLAERSAGIAVHVVQQLCLAGVQVGALVAGDEMTLVPVGRGVTQRDALSELLATVGDAAHSQLPRLLQAAWRCHAAAACIVISSAPVEAKYGAHLRRLGPLTVVPVRQPESSG